METLTLTELATAMARRWQIIAAGLAAGVLLGIGVHAMMPTTYEALAVVRVDAKEPDTVDMPVEVAIAMSRRVTSQALESWGRPEITIAEFENSASASTVRDSRILHITYTAASARTAARGANELAYAYLAVRAEDLGGPKTPTDQVGTVLDPARVPSSPAGPGLLTSTAAGLVLGLLVTAPLAARPIRREEVPAS